MVCQVKTTQPIRIRFVTSDNRPEVTILVVTSCIFFKAFRLPNIVKFDFFHLYSATIAQTPRSIFIPNASIKTACSEVVPFHGFACEELRVNSPKSSKISLFQHIGNTFF
jgi:hypothetical protein